MFFCSSRKYKFPGRNDYEWSWTIPNILEYLRIITINYGWYGPVTVCYGLLRIGMKQNVFKTYFHNYVFEGSWKTENSKLDPRLFSVVWWTLQACMMTHRFKLHYDGCILLLTFYCVTEAIVGVTLGSRRWNWKLRDKAWENQDPELLLHSSYSFWPWLSTSGSGRDWASTQPWKKCEKRVFNFSIFPIF